TIGNADNLTTLAAYKIQNGSPLINKGADLTSAGINTGGKDFWGNPAPQQGAFDIGANESPYTSPPPGNFIAHINFQPSTSSGFTGYVPDLGNTYGSRNG